MDYDVMANNITEVETVCIECNEKGVTKFLPTRIPYFREVVIASFECPHCEYRNNELIYAAAIADHGVRFELSARSAKDLTRRIVVSEYCIIGIPTVDFEVDAPGNSGCYLTTVEGFLLRVIDGVKSLLENEGMEQVRPLLEKLQLFSTGSEPFILVIDDLTGNSFLERFDLSDEFIKEEKYVRTPTQQAKLGMAQPDDDDTPLDGSLCVFVDRCPGCSHPAETRMHPINIPHFKEVIIMATICDSCGYKSNEVKSGGAVHPKGRRIILSLESIEDLSRDVLKSESCMLCIPEIDLELGTGTLGGRFTTIEGLLDQVKDELISKVPFSFGDSAETDKKQILDNLVQSLNKIIEGELRCQIILDDPLGNSYVQSLFAPDPDPLIKEEEYERTFEQNEEFGLNDIKVDNY